MKSPYNYFATLFLVLIISYSFQFLILSCSKSNSIKIDSISIQNDSIPIIVLNDSIPFSDSTVMEHKKYSLNIQDSLLYEIDKKNSEYFVLLKESNDRYINLSKRVRKLKRIDFLLNQSDSIEIKSDTIIIK